ncbi:MAG TPA: hypothetical protein VGP42_14485 [Stellaceae bacterium]|jgi:hypothetical protein|nr:hypothetical protein [Stellaceae bacterium]
MKRTFGLILAFLSLAFGSPVKAAEPVPVLAAPMPDLAVRLVGNTLSAIAFIPRRPGGPGGGELTRLMLQAYFGPDGRALVRLWDPWHDAYTVPAERKWTLTGRTLCVDLPAPGNGPMCADVHVWGPRIAGVGAQPYAMLDGDLKPGNVIGGRR